MKATRPLVRKTPWGLTAIVAALLIAGLVAYRSIAASYALTLLIAGISLVRARRDHADRWQAEEKLKRHDRLSAMISGITALGVRVRDRDDLFKNACRIEQGIVEIGVAVGN